jgi:hypothetical protein
MTGTTWAASRATVFALGSALLSLFSSITSAATIPYGNFAGATVMYTNVTETSATDPVPLFGAPMVVGDDLSFFDPGAAPASLGFGAISAGGVGDVTDSFLSFGVMANPGFGVSSISFSEGGDYSMSALGVALAQVKASLTIFEIEVTHVDGAPITPFTLSSAPLPSVTYNLPGDPANGIWSLSDSFDLDAELTSRNIPFVAGVSKFTVKLDDTLIALSQPGSAAIIMKKAFDIDIETEVPEPSAIALWALATVGAALVARRRR